MKILVTGGAGYIASHTLIELIAAGYEPVVVDNYSNSSPDVIARVEKITGTVIKTYEADVTDIATIKDIFNENEFGAVIHFAGYKAVGESVENPLKYYSNNLIATITILECMNKFGVKNIIFSSSATVYGEGNKVPFNENMHTFCTNPYGWTKSMSERILKDFALANKDFSVVLLRYFNPVGAHNSGLIGENPKGIPNNLVPYIQQVASEKREKLTVFGNDYDTPDGTGVRDYIHVMDLAKGHVAALNYALNNKGVEVFNLGTGKGTSVLELIKIFEKINHVKIPYMIGNRREGDIAECYADVEKAKEILGWKAELTVEDMCRDAWRWECNKEKEN